MKPLAIFLPGFLLLLCAMILPVSGHAQGKFAEKIEKKCKDIPYEKRVRITVGSFKTTTNRAYGQFAGELQTMLSNALVMTECFQVLASTKSNIMDDIQDEKDYQKTDDVDEEAAVESGKMLGAQLVVTGEITEFAEGREGFNVGVIGLSSNKAQVGFILQIGNPQTRQIIFSESINANDIAVGGFSGVRILGLPAIGSFKTKAMANAVEKAIIKAVELIVAQKDKIQAMPQGGSADMNSEAEKTTIVKVENVDYSKLGVITNFIKEFPKLKSATKVLKEGVGSVTVLHEGTLEELADFIAEKVAGSGYELTDVVKGKITLKPQK